MEEELFKEEDTFFCGICGKELQNYEEIDEEICHECLSRLLK